MKVVGSLETVILAIAGWLGIEFKMLFDFANADLHTGWDFDQGAWPCGSLHRPEGQILYALVRALKPKQIAEVGTWYGCSATHMAQALADDGGEHAPINCIDINPNGSMIPSLLRQHINLMATDGRDYLRGLKDGSLGLFYEDASHSMEDVRDFWTLGLQKVEPGGVIVSHDPENAVVGPSVIAGVEAAGVTDYLIVRVPPSDCGLLIYRKPMEVAVKPKTKRHVNPG